MPVGTLPSLNWAQQLWQANHEIRQLRLLLHAKFYGGVVLSIAASIGRLALSKAHFTARTRFTRRCKGT